METIWFYICLLFYCAAFSNVDSSNTLSMKEIFVFSTTNKNWHWYNWDKITTIVQAGYYDAEMLVFAHSKNVSVVSVANIDTAWLTDTERRRQWVLNVTNDMWQKNLDGINIDFEDAINASDVQHRDGLTALMLELYMKMKPYNKQLTIDFAWSSKCIDSRCYDYKALASYADFVFIMAYDERSQIFGPCIAWANSPYNMTEAGLSTFDFIHPRSEKIVLGVPWYGYNYPCTSYDANTNECRIKQVPFRGCPCSDAAGTQIGYSGMMELVKQSVSGLQWDATARSPFATYKNQKTGQYNQIWFDNPTSLKQKYELAKLHNLRGVGMWEADSLDYSDPNKRHYLSDMWDALPNRLPH